MGSATTDTSWSEYALAELKAAGHRTGGARSAVVEQLGGQHCCLSAQAIHDALRDQGSSIGLASVYRALELLTAEKLVHRVDIDSVAHYEPANPGGEHHHHVVCDECGDVAAFEDPSLERAIDRVADKVNYDVSGHDVVLHGICPTCK